MSCGSLAIVTSRRVDDSVDTIDAEARMVPARHFVAVMQVRICGAFGCPFPSHQFEMKTIVPSWVKKTKTEPGYGHRLLQSKIEFVGVPGNRYVEVRHADGCVVDLERSKGIGVVRFAQYVHSFP